MPVRFSRIAPVLAAFVCLSAAALVRDGCAADGPAPPVSVPPRGGPPSSAGDPEPAKPAASPASDAVARATMAHGLAALGREARSPVALAAAAELFASVRLADWDLPRAGPVPESPEHGADGAPAEGRAGEAGPKAAPPDEPATLYAEAAALARASSDGALAEAAERESSASGRRQPAPGEGGRHRDTVRPCATDIYRVRYNGGETARATVAADGSARLELNVFSFSGDLVTAGRPETAGTGVSAWQPSRTGYFFLHVKNPGGQAVSYLLYTS